MKSLFGGIVAMLLVASVGCNQQSPQQPYQNEPIAAQTCVGPNNVVMADNYCDPNWVAEQQAMARRNNNLELLNTLLLYHMMWSTTPYSVGTTFVYAPNTYWRTRPMGYSIMPRSAYYDNVVVHHTIVVNGGRAVATRPLAASSFTSRSTTRTTTTTTTTSPSAGKATTTSRPTFAEKARSSGSTTRTTTTSRSFSSSSRRR